MSYTSFPVSKNLRPDAAKLDRKLVIRLRDEQFRMVRRWADESEVGISVLVRSLIKRENDRRTRRVA